MSDEINKAEEQRRLAEEERDQHELRRRIAEGGPDQHVPGDIVSPPGRWEAEEDRRAAEERRAKAEKVGYTRIATLVAIPLALIVLIPSVVGIIALQKQADRLDAEIANRCRDGRVNRESIRQSIFDGLGTLGYRYDPEQGKIVPDGRPLDYYTTHPEERAEALARAATSLERFPPIKC